MKHAFQATKLTHSAAKFLLGACIVMSLLPQTSAAIAVPQNALDGDAVRPIPEPAYPCTVIAGCVGYPHHILIQTSTCTRASFPADVEDAIRRKHDQCASVNPPVAPTYSCTCTAIPSPEDPRATSLKDRWTGN